MVQISQAGTYFAPWDFQTKASPTSPPWAAVKLCNLPACVNFWPCNRIVQKAYWKLSCSAVLPKAPSTSYRERDYLFMLNTSLHCPFHQTINQWIDCSQSPIFPWDRRWRSLSPTGPPSWSLDASDTFCTLPSFARIKRPRWRSVGLNDRHLRSHGQIGDREQSHQWKDINERNRFSNITLEPKPVQFFQKLFFLLTPANSYQSLQRVTKMREHWASFYSFQSPQITWRP